MFLWGMNVIALKVLVEHFPPIAMQASRVALVGLVVTVVLYARRELKQLTKYEWKYLCLAAVFGMLFHHAFLALGLTGTTAANAALILGLIPIMTSIFAIIFLADRLTPLRSIGIVLGFLGVALVVLQNGGVGGIALGDFFVFLSMACQAFSFIHIKKLTATLSPKQITAMLMVIGSVFLFIASFMFEQGRMGEMGSGSMGIWLIFLFSAIFATALGHLLFNTAIGKIGPGESAIFNNLVPFFALVGAFFFLGEAIYFTQMAGFILIVGGVLFGSGYADYYLLKKRKT